MNKLERLRSAAAENPVLLLFLGACPAMGASAELRGALILGLTVPAVSVLTALIISAIRKYLEESALIWASVLISAGLASIAVLLTEAYAPGLYPEIALYLSVCAVNLMIFTGAVTGPAKSLSSGLIFLGAIALTAVIREILGSASIWGLNLPALEAYKIPLLAKAPGGFLVFSLVLAAVNAAFLRRGKEQR